MINRHTSKNQGEKPNRKLVLFHGGKERHDKAPGGGGLDTPEPDPPLNILKAPTVEAITIGTKGNKKPDEGSRVKANRGKYRKARKPGDPVSRYQRPLPDSPDDHASGMMNAANKTSAEG